MASSEDETIDFIVEDVDEVDNALEYNDFKLDELRNLCKVRGLSSTGRKHELVDRLKCLDETGPMWDEVESPIHIPTFRKKSGPRIFLGENATAVEYFDLLFTPEIQHLFVVETNRYVAQRLDHLFTASSSKDRWEPVTISEIRAFLGCLIFIGLCSLGDMKDYWSEELGQDRIRNVFSYHRFTDIFRFIHCNDNSTAFPKDHESFDKLHKVRPVISLLQKSFQQCWVPHQKNSIDEGMISFTGRSSLKQYMKDKPNKWGFKMWKLVDSNMGGVDTNDQMMTYNNLSRKAYRWWLPIFLDLFKQSIVNAWILKQHQPNQKKQSQKQFRIELFQVLVGDFSSRNREKGQQPNPSNRFDGIQHFISNHSKRGYCKNSCGKKVHYKCCKCDIFLCIDCFRHYHTTK